MTKSEPRKGSITELVLQKGYEDPIFRFYYTWGDDPIDMIKEMYVERGYTVKEQSYETPSTENGSKNMAVFIERIANRFFDLGKEYGD